MPGIMIFERFLFCRLVSFQRKLNNNPIAQTHTHNHKKPKRQNILQCICRRRKYSHLQATKCVFFALFSFALQTYFYLFISPEYMCVCVLYNRRWPPSVVGRQQRHLSTLFFLSVAFDLNMIFCTLPHLVLPFCSFLSFVHLRNAFCRKINYLFSWNFDKIFCWILKFWFVYFEVDCQFPIQVGRNDASRRGRGGCNPRGATQI